MDLMEYVFGAISPPMLLTMFYSQKLSDCLIGPEQAPGFYIDCALGAGLHTAETLNAGFFVHLHQIFFPGNTFHRASLETQ